MKTLAINKRANYDYQILDKYEAGLVLDGHEVKSVKLGHINLKGSYVAITNNKKGNPQASLINVYITPYKYAGKMPDYDPIKSRKLLLHKSELQKLIGKTAEHLTLVPIRVYNKQGFIKLEFAIGKGKKKIDKREDIKKREVERDMRRNMMGK
ncbi:MAG: SsrA-binding protein SmpB [bacterium]